MQLLLLLVKYNPVKSKFRHPWLIQLQERPCQPKILRHREVNIDTIITMNLNLLRNTNRRTLTRSVRIHRRIESPAGRLSHPTPLHLETSNMRTPLGPRVQVTLLSLLIHFITTLKPAIHLNLPTVLLIHIHTHPKNLTRLLITLLQATSRLRRHLTMGILGILHRTSCPRDQQNHLKNSQVLLNQAQQLHPLQL